MKWPDNIHLLSDRAKNSIINSVTQRVSFNIGIRAPELYRPLEHKPRIRQLSSGKWLTINTCWTWSYEFDWIIAIHWCDLQNNSNPSTEE